MFFFIELHNNFESIFHKLHQHTGRQGCWDRIKKRYYWQAGEKYVRMKTKECVICGHKNNVWNKAPVAPLKPIPVSPKIFWRVHVDLTAKLPTTHNRNKFIAIAVCAFSKYIEAKGNVPIFLGVFTSL